MAPTKRTYVLQNFIKKNSSIASAIKLFDVLRIVVSLLQLPSRIEDSEIARLAALFSPFTLETVAIRYLGVSKADVDNFKFERKDDSDGFKRDL